MEALLIGILVKLLDPVLALTAFFSSKLTGRGTKGLIVGTALGTVANQILNALFGAGTNYGTSLLFAGLASLLWAYLAQLYLSRKLAKQEDEPAVRKARR